MSSHTRQLAEYVSNFKLGDVPQEVIARAKGVILDGLGCGLYGSDVTWTNILAEVVAKLEPQGGQASIWGRHQTASAVNAALVNGTMVQGYELDDVHINGALHTCSIVLPAAFAAAEYIGADRVDGKRLLTAIIAGFEVGPRLGKCMRGEQMLFNGWHSGAIIAPFPAAAAAGVVLGLNSDQLFHAFGIAGTQACGLMAAQYGSMVKRMQHAKGAQNGLYGAFLAADGFTGIENIFEEPYGGFCSTFSHSTDQFDLPALTDGLGERWETMMFTIKTYACRGGNHSAVNAIDELIKETGLKADEVDEIVVRVTEAMVKHAGWSPYVGRGLTEAQMHTGFCLAVRIIEGDVFVDQMIEANVARPDLVELANRVKVVRDPEREKMGNDYRKGSDVSVKLKNGKMLRKVIDFPLGSDRRPLSGEQMAAKFRRLAAKVLASDKVAQLENAIWDLERLPTVEPVVRALQA